MDERLSVESFKLRYVDRATRYSGREAPVEA
jgi:hypothetical protein